MSTVPTPEAHPDYWKKCSSCKKPISYRALYWVCNVSTCNRKRVGYQFCSVSCWDAHVPGMNHRESWAEERHAPSLDQWKQMLFEESQPKKRPRKVEEAPPPPVAAAPSGPPRVIVRKRSE